VLAVPYWKLGTAPGWARSAGKNRQQIGCASGGRQCPRLYLRSKRAARLA